MINASGKSRRGFASMDREKQREIARKGGKAAHAKGTAHEFTPDEAREAGRKGGQTVSQNREHMARIGREGGHVRAQRASRVGFGDSAQHEGTEIAGSHEMDNLVTSQPQAMDTNSEAPQAGTDNKQTEAA